MNGTLLQIGLLVLGLIAAAVVALLYDPNATVYRCIVGIANRQTRQDQLLGMQETVARKLVSFGARLMPRSVFPLPRRGGGNQAIYFEPALDPIPVLAAEDQEDRSYVEEPATEPIMLTSGSFDASPLPLSLVRRRAVRGKVGVAADAPPAGVGPLLERMAAWDESFGFDPYRFPLGWTLHSSGEPEVSQVTFTPGKKASVIMAAVSGTTGQGKDTWMIQTLLAMMTRATPDQLQLAVIDGKGLDYHAFLPKAHVMGVAEEPEEIGSLMTLLKAERVARRHLLQAAGVKNFWEYQTLRAQPEHAGLPNVPLLVVYIAEFSLLEEELGEKVFWQWLGRFMSVGRAFGIHMIVSGQTFSNTPTFWRRQVQLFYALRQPSPDDDRPCMTLPTETVTRLGAVPPSSLPADKGYALVVCNGRVFNVRAGSLPIGEEAAILATLPDRE